MYSSKHKSNVALFPLCDTGGVLIDALCDTSEKASTRGDALVFAWRLQLPASMNVADAANAVLKVALCTPRTEWSREQLVIIRELMVLAGREGSTPKPLRSQPSRNRGKTVPRDASKRTKPAAVPDPASQINPFTEDLPTSKHTFQPKESKQWWKLVGRPDPDGGSSGQRKTRTERVSREP